jgi:phosphogluconate dehydratase
MSGASGKVPAAIHLTPEALDGGPIARIRDGDIIKLCGHDGILEVKADIASREPAQAPAQEDGMGRELFAHMRAQADSAERGACAMLAGAGL